MSYRWCILLSSLLSVGCTAGDGKQEQSTGTQTPTDSETVEEPVEPAPEVDPDPLDALYAIDRVISVDIELDPDDWETIRNESRNLLDLLSGDCRDQPFGSPYTWFEASVTIDGETYDRIEVRKKGFIGSLSVDRPSLKLDLGEFEEDWTFEGARRLTLNNAVSDPSVVRQCLTYGAFIDAGLPAPRCGFARVHVNGEDLGLYVNVEPVKEPFLKHHWGDDSGNLYEGTLSDFTPTLSGTLEPKTNEDDTDLSDIQALVDALDVSDDALIDSLDEHMDLDQFFSHWAMEVLTKHQDGYAANTNNFYIYADPSDGRFDFITWGTDDTMSPYWWNGAGSPKSVFATGNITHRLYNTDAGQQRYLARLEELLDTVWQESVLLERLDRMEAALLAELGDENTRTIEAGIAEVRRVVQTRRGEIEEELASGPARWPWDPAAPFCVQQLGEFDMSVSTTWGSLGEDWYTYGDAELALVFEEESVLLEQVGAAAGNGDDGPLLLVAGITSTGDEMLLVFFFPEAISTGPIEVDLIHAAGNLYVMGPGDTDYQYGGELGGTLSFSEAGSAYGDPVVATMDGGLYVWDW